MAHSRLLVLGCVDPLSFFDRPLWLLSVAVDLNLLESHQVIDDLVIAFGFRRRSVGWRAGGFLGSDDLLDLLLWRGGLPKQLLLRMGWLQVLFLALRTFRVVLAARQWLGWGFSTAGFPLMRDQS